MKFVVSSTMLLEHLQAISRIVDPKDLKFDEDYLISYVEVNETTTIKKQPRSLYFHYFLSGSIKQLIRQLAIYTGQILSTLLRVLRNTRIHSLSIFFGLCCSRSGYIFEAITGTSSHPNPASL
jgi:hypothetical protein